MSYLTNLLSGLFSADMGISEEGRLSALNNIRVNEDQREKDGIREELLRLYESSDADWISLLENERYEVFPAETQDEAKDFVTEKIWNVLFPDQLKIPSVGR